MTTHSHAAERRQHYNLFRVRFQQFAVGQQSTRCAPVLIYRFSNQQFRPTAVSAIVSHTAAQQKREVRMYLFEAVRLGALILPQGFGINRSLNTACAMDGALLAVGDPAVRENTVALWERRKQLLPFAYADAPACPVCADAVNTGEHAIMLAVARKCRSVAGVVAIHLNDRHRWSREQIATWLEPLELAYAAQHPELYRVVEATQPAQLQEVA